MTHLKICDVKVVFDSFETVYKFAKLCTSKVGGFVRDAFLQISEGMAVPCLETRCCDICRRQRGTTKAAVRRAGPWSEDMPRLVHTFRFSTGRHLTGRAKAQLGTL